MMGNVAQRANREIRKMLLAKNIRHWQLAKKMEIGEATLVRWLREPLPKEIENRIKSIIEEW